MKRANDVEKLDEINISYCIETTEKEVQDTSCRGSGGVLQL
jgi:hypothetical protein